MEILKEKTTKKDEKPIGKHLWQIARALFYSLQTSLSNHKLKLKLFFDLNLLIKPLLHYRTKLIPKSIDVSSLSCHSMDPTTAYYSPQEVEFSCSNTPSYPFSSHTRKLRRGGPRKQHFVDSEAVARAFEFLNREMRVINDEDEFGAEEMTPSPSPVWAWRGRSWKSSPVAVRQLRVTDSPFPIEEGRGRGGVNQVDREAEAFIKRFYEQLQLQQLQLQQQEQRRLRYEAFISRQAPACG